MGQGGSAWSCSIQLGAHTRPAEGIALRSLPCMMLMGICLGGSRFKGGAGRRRAGSRRRPLPVRHQQLRRRGEVRQEGGGQGAHEALPHPQCVQVSRPPGHAAQEDVPLGRVCCAQQAGHGRRRRAVRGRRLARHKPAGEVGGAVRLRPEGTAVEWSRSAMQYVCILWHIIDGIT